MRRLPRRPLLVALAVTQGLLLGGAIYVGYQVLSAPGPRDAPGWSRLADMPDPRGETAVAVAGSRLYVIGGLTGFDFAASSAVSVLDAGTGAWTTGPTLPEARHHAAAAAIGGDVYLSGGAATLADGTPLADLWVLRSGTAAWERLAPMPVGRYGHRIVSVDGRLYVIGGLSPPGGGAGTEEPGAVLIYDPATDSWSTGAPMPDPRHHLGAAEVDGEIWAIGGRTDRRNHDRVDIYDPVADAWRAGPALPEPTSGAAEAAIGGRILVSGGEDPATGRMVDRHWILDPRPGAAAAWLALAPPPLTVHGVPGAALEGRLVIAGGASRAGGQSNTAWSSLTQVLLELP